MKIKLIVLNLLLVLFLFSCNLNGNNNENLISSFGGIKADIITDDGLQFGYDNDEIGFVLVNADLFDKNAKVVYVPKMLGVDGTPVVGLGHKCFSDFSILEEIHLPKTITRIDPLVFFLCDNLTKIYYEGRKADWYAIRKSSSWYEYCGDFTVICLDGELSKEDSIIMQNIL